MLLIDVYSTPNYKLGTLIMIIIKICLRINTPDSRVSTTASTLKETILPCLLIGDFNK